MSETTNNPSENKPAQQQTAPAAKDASLESLNSQVARVKHEVEKLEKRFGRGAWMTGIVGVILLLFMCAYFFYGYKVISGLVDDPENLFLSAQQQLSDNKIPSTLQETRRRIEREIRDNAPEWAEQMSQQILENAPGMRESLENFIVDQLTESVDRYASVSEEQLRSMLKVKQNRDLVNSAFKELGSSRTLSKETKQEFKQALFDKLELDIEEQAGFVLHTLTAFNENFSKMREGKGLDQGQRTFRRVMMHIKRLQMEVEDPSLEGVDILPRASSRAGKVIPKQDNSPEDANSGSSDSKTENKEGSDKDTNEADKTGNDPNAKGPTVK